MTAIIYTYPPDYVMAAMVARSLIALGVNPVLAIERDAPRLHVSGAETIRTSEDRRRNLNGKEFILANLRRMLELAGGDDYVMKMDSDTLALSLDHLEGRTEAAVGIWNGQMQGCAYALRREALPRMIELAEEKLSSGPRLMEDFVTGKLAEMTGPVHTPRYGTEESRYAAYRPGRDPEFYRERGTCILNFPLRKDFDRRAIAAAMQPFL